VAQRLGLPAGFTTDTELPFEVKGAIRLDGQAQFHPRNYCLGLAAAVVAAGGSIYEQTTAVAVDDGKMCTVKTADGAEIRAPHVVVATHIPFLDRGLYFAKAHPMKSYAIAAPCDTERAPRGMYISVDQPTRSIRSTPADGGGRMLIVGGEGHKPGDDPDTNARYARLESFMKERFGITGAEYHWSTHDYMPVDKLPYIGRLSRRDKHVYVATGFAKWGLTKGTLAAGIISDAILDRENQWAELYDSTRLDARHSAVRFAKENAGVGLRFFRDRVRTRDGREDVELLTPSEGTIARIGAKQYAAYRDDAGELHLLSARCTHLGCIVGWNPADRAWECPCHGSRFAADGSLVQGPATADLPHESLPE